MMRAALIGFLFASASLFAQGEHRLQFDPFNNLPTVKAGGAAGTGGAAGAGGDAGATEPMLALQLRGIVFSGPDSSVNLNGEILPIGGSYWGYRVENITESSVVLVKGKKRHTLRMDEPMLRVPQSSVKPTGNAKGAVQSIGWFRGAGDGARLSRGHPGAPSSHDAPHAAWHQRCCTRNADPELDVDLDLDLDLDLDPAPVFVAVFVGSPSPAFLRELFRVRANV